MRVRLIPELWLHTGGSGCTKEFTSVVSRWRDESSENNHASRLLELRVPVRNEPPYRFKYVAAGAGR